MIMEAIACGQDGESYFDEEFDEARKKVEE
jgi:hypothetical protein